MLHFLLHGRHLLLSLCQALDCRAPEATPKGYLNDGIDCTVWYLGILLAVIVFEPVRFAVREHIHIYPDVVCIVWFPSKFFQIYCIGESFNMASDKFIYHFAFSLLDHLAC